MNYEGGTNMITFTVLLIAALVLVIISAIALLLGGAGFILVFGDVIAFALIVWAIVRLFRRKK
jgi:hypothetical protein